MTGNGFEELSGVFVPAAKGFDDERLEEYPLGTAIVGVIPSLGGFSHFDGRRSSVGGAMKDCILDRRNDADIEGNFAAVDPILDEDVGRARERAGNETRHFLLRVKRCVLRLREDSVPNSVVPASFHSMIVAAVKCMIAQFVLDSVAVGGAAFRGRALEHGSRIARESCPRLEPHFVSGL